MEPTSSIDKAFSLVIQEERQRSSSFNLGSSVETTALSVKNQSFTHSSGFTSNSGKNFKGNAEKGRPMCSYCGKLGHIKEKYYKLVGFPPGYKQKGKAPMANQISLEGDQSQTGGTQLGSGNFPFTTDQCQQLISLLNTHAFSFDSCEGVHSANFAISSTTASGNTCHVFQDCMTLSMQHFVFAVNPVHKTAFNGETWVLDTGATDHIIHFVTLFTKITSSISTFVQLPNGEKVTVTHIGTIQITSTLILENVLCVPFFSFNLISVSKLTKCLSCCLVFLSKFCFIQDLSCWKTIGVGKLHNNLYLLQVSLDCTSISGVSSILQSVFDSFVNSVSNVPFVSKPFLWHLRLGHVSNNKLNTLHSHFPDVIQFQSNKDCVLCPIAK